MSLQPRQSLPAPESPVPMRVDQMTPQVSVQSGPSAIPVTEESAGWLPPAAMIPSQAETRVQTQSTIADLVRVFEPLIRQLLIPVPSVPLVTKPSLLSRALYGLGLTKAAPIPVRAADLVLVIDTSGSMGEAVQRCSAALARLARVARGPEALVRIIAHTTRVDVDRTVAASSLLERGYPIIAGGGTDYRDVLRILARDQVPAAIWLTDGDGFLDGEPGCAITWAITRLQECNWEGSSVGSRCRRGELATAVIDLVG